ncbi:MAG: hypothetical protein V4722_22390 [Bacteroidota bacterium]
MKLRIMFLLGFACSLLAVDAQNKYNPRDYKSKPVWIQMMDDTTVNYFETVRAFRTFYTYRFLPKEPLETEESDAFEQEVGLEENETANKTVKELERERIRDNKRKSRYSKEPNYAAEVRAFKAWFYTTKSWLRPDGSIIGPAEQQSLIDRQRAELKAIEAANKQN